MANSKSPPLKQVIKAVLGAFIGVQSEQQRQQDFTTTNPLPYIIVGVVMAIMFVVAVVLVVSWVLR
ncbi:DUF2970 domain-containing protein [Alkalimonas collagenimarina]|uniref:DUF2970 domain-containing protein n=1 Tax=Alkalimonas collagenimarina TaxID=400390 RepID=A0ABT9H245_9GAMM|nr:DUF2970 domain-containing protein [Alkalimonas collagenimarina]MDP4537293.1 DUF2970 domain-containing protein [Alkalimonas collagenimarina]